MGTKKAVKTSCWLKYLKFQGCIKKKDSGGSHSKYAKKGMFRSLTVRENDKEVPELHIHTSLKTLV